MRLSKQQLVKYQHEPLLLDEVLDLKAKGQERFGDWILDLSPITVTGTVQSFANDDIVIRVQLAGQITVPSTRSKEAVTLPIDLTVEERYVNDLVRLDEFEDTEAVFIIENDQIDIDQMVLDNIIATLPSQILTPAEQTATTLPNGDDWQVISQQSYDETEKFQSQTEELDPRLAKLDDFFNK